MKFLGLRLGLARHNTRLERSARGPTPITDILDGKGYARDQGHCIGVFTRTGGPVCMLCLARE
jgi:hypothetical protein